jgi:hypothetical protein
MKMSIRSLAKDEKGQALILALILLAVGGLILAPLLAYMRTGLTAGEVCEVKTNELYAADAGAEDAVWKIQNQVDQVEELSNSCGNHTWSYNITDVNGKSVAVTITYVNNTTYHVVSTATGDGSGTQIEAYVTGEIKYGNYADIMNNVITSLGGYTLRPGANITFPEGNEPYTQYPPQLWPPAAYLEEFYSGNVTGATNYTGNTVINLQGNSCPPGPIYINDVQNNSWPSGLGPLYIDGELDIVNSSSDGATLNLTGTLYITGDTQIYGPTAQEPYKLTLDLNGHTIFVASNTSGSHNALEIQKCNIIGPGVIIAVGDIYFAPKAETGEDAPIFIMSVLGTTTLQPNGDFYGAVAGNVTVTLQPGTKLAYPEVGFGGYGLNFPSFLVEIGRVYSIASWEISPL